MNDVDERHENEARPDGLPAGVMPSAVPMHDEDGNLLDSFVAIVETAVNDRDADTLRELAGDIHESDLGALIAELRAELISIMGRDFDFTALTEVDDNIREDILDELPNSAVALYVQDLES